MKFVARAVIIALSVVVFFLGCHFATRRAEQIRPSSSTESDDICRLFRDGSFRRVELLQNSKGSQRKQVDLVEFGGRRFVVKTPLIFTSSYSYLREAVHRLFDSDGANTTRLATVTLDDLIHHLWPVVESLHGVAYADFQRQARIADKDKDSAWSLSEVNSLLSEIVRHLNSMPSNEVFYHRSLGPVSYLAEYLGYCNRSYVEGAMTAGDLRTFIYDHFPNVSRRDGFYAWKRVVLSLIDLITAVKSTPLGPLLFCDIAARNFGVDADWRVKLIDIDSVFPAHVVQRAVNHSCRSDDDVCAFHRCRSRCSSDTRRCLPVRSDVNAYMICRLVFNLDGLIRDQDELRPHFGANAFDVLQRIVRRCSHADRDGEAAEIVKQMQFLVRSATFRQDALSEGEFSTPIRHLHNTYTPKKI